MWVPFSQYNLFGYTIPNECLICFYQLTNPEKTWLGSWWERGQGQVNLWGSRGKSYCVILKHDAFIINSFNIKNW